MEKIILTIDVGTGSSRAGLIKSNGDIIGFSQFEYDQISKYPGWAEQQPSMWWSSAAKGIKELLNKYPEYKDKIAVISACGQMHGTVLLDSNGNLAVDTALLWNDKRSMSCVNDFTKKQDTKEWLKTVNNPPTAAWPAFKLIWIQKNIPEAWTKTKKLLMPKDYINYKLTGEMATDYSEASCFYLMDWKTKEWSKEALSYFGFSESLMPKIKQANEILGYITEEASKETGLPKGIPVIVGCADMAATILGSGVYEPGVVSDSTGTSTLLTLVAKKPILDLQLNNLHLANNAWGGFTILDAGGDSVRWLRLACTDNAISYTDLMKLAHDVPAGSNGLVFLPYLTGERVAVKTNSRAQFFGLQRKHRLGDLVRSVLEGVGYAAYKNMKQLEIGSGQKVESIIASGGGAKDDLWLEIKSSIYNTPITKTLNEENGTTGCAIMGAVAVGIFDDVKEGVNKMVQFDKVIKPNPRYVDLYQKYFELYSRLYDQSLDYYDELDALTDIK